MQVEFIDGGPSHCYVRVSNTHCGVLEPKEDGYWDWYPDLRPGYVPAWMLHAIAKKLDELNEEWDKVVSQL